MGTGGFTSGLGDLICQQGIEKRGWKDHEMYRTRRLMVYGCFCFAPFANRWMAVLNKINVGGKATSEFLALPLGVLSKEWKKEEEDRKPGRDENNLQLQIEFGSFFF